MLTAEQKSHFEPFGFLWMQRYFSPDEMDAFTCAFDELLTEDRQGQSFPGEKRQVVFGFIERRSLLRRLAKDHRIYEPIEQLLGQDFVWIGSAGNLYVGDTGWHPDCREPNYGVIKVIFYSIPWTKIPVACASFPVPTDRRCTPMSYLSPASSQTPV